MDKLWISGSKAPLFPQPIRKNLDFTANFPLCITYFCKHSSFVDKILVHNLPTFYPQGFHKPLHTVFYILFKLIHNPSPEGILLFSLKKFPLYYKIPSLTVNRRKNRRIPCIYWAAAIFSLLRTIVIYSFPLLFFWIVLILLLVMNW